MRNMKYLLIAAILSIASVLSAANTATQTLAQQPEIIQMQSTSVMQTSGSTLPQAAVTGTATTSGENGSSIGQGHIRRGTWNPGGEEPDEGDNTEPWADPIGDGIIALMLLAGAYVCVRAFRRKRA